MWWKHVKTSLYDFKLMLQCFSHFTVQQLNNSTLMIISNFIQFNFLPFLAGELFFANPKTAASISLGHQKVIIHARISNQTKTFTCSVWNCGDTLMVFFHARMPYLWICFRSAKRLGQCLCQHLICIYTVWDGMAVHYPQQYWCYQVNKAVFTTVI